MQDLLMQLECAEEKSIELEPVEEHQFFFNDEILEVVTSGITSISVNGIEIPSDADKNVEIPIDGTIAAYLQQNIGNGLKLEGNLLTVDTTNIVEADNTKPVTSAAVHLEIGNIDALLKTI